MGLLLLLLLVILFFGVSALVFSVKWLLIIGLIVLVLGYFGGRGRSYGW